VVGFRGTYHAVLGRPCYAKFMAVPNYTYLKLKMSGPNRVITVGSTYRHAYECDVECVEYAEAEREMCPWAISKYFGDLVSNTSA
jgi:hypothetical protein